MILHRDGAMTFFLYFYKVRIFCLRHWDSDLRLKVNIFWLRHKLNDLSELNRVQASKDSNTSKFIKGVCLGKCILKMWTYSLHSELLFYICTDMYRILITASLVSCLYFEHGDQFVGYILKSKRTKQLQEYSIPKKNKKRFAYMF